VRVPDNGKKLCVTKDCLNWVRPADAKAGIRKCRNCRTCEFPKCDHPCGVQDGPERGPRIRFCWCEECGHRTERQHKRVKPLPLEAIEGGQQEITASEFDRMMRMAFGEDPEFTPPDTDPLGIDNPVLSATLYQIREMIDAGGKPERARVAVIIRLAKQFENPASLIDPRVMAALSKEFRAALADIQPKESKESDNPFDLGADLFGK
jgi:hypothetical protein